MASTQRERRPLLKHLIPRILFPRSKTVASSPDVAVPVQSVPIPSIPNGHIDTIGDVHSRTRVFSRFLPLSIGRRRRAAPNLTAPRRTLLQAFVHPLKILEKTVEGIPVPGLKGALGALVAIVDIVQETDQNKRDLQEIFNMIERLDYLLSPFRTLPDRCIEVPGALKEHIEGFQNGLASIEDTCRNLRNCTLVDGLLYSSEDKQIIAGVFRQLRFLLENLLTGSVLRIEVNTSNIHTDVHSLIINAIPRSQAARWRNGTPGECSEGTRTAILEDIMTWIQDGSDTRCVCWLNSVAGAGKSTVARSVAHWAADRGILGGSFFCSRNDSQQKDARLVIPTIAFHLSELDMAFRHELVSVVRHWDGIDLETPSQQLERLVIKPLLSIGRRSDPLLLIVDALDECTNEIARRELVEGFLSIDDDLHALKVLITSRPEVPERETFQSVSSARWKDIILHRMDRRVVDADIRMYLHAKLITMVPSPPISGDQATETENTWPPEHLLDQLVQKSAGLFIFATTVCRFIESPGDRVEQLIQIASVSESHNEGEYGLDHLYRRTVSSAIENLPDSKVNDLRTVLGTIILLQQPMTLRNICLLLKMTRNHVEGMLSRFHSVVVVPSDDRDFVRLFHSSFRDFLTSNTRCSNKCEVEWCMNSRECAHTKLFVSRLRVRPAQNHRSICFRLLDLMKNAFPSPHADNMSGDHDATTDDDILRYACLYWSDHLSLVSTHNTAEVRIVVDLINSFLCEKGDAWLSYMGKDTDTFKIGVQSLDTIDEWGAKLPGQFKLHDWVATARTNFTAMALLGNLS
ncbi:hypothetical protein EDD85DRAFT_4592 [Armillaria nabsnona]|nr:hypothetical protein EDD85DRAFT_4592 [Armillaria nabsnona]